MLQVSVGRSTLDLDTNITNNSTCSNAATAFFITNPTVSMTSLLSSLTE
jgi:hypothetical protein